MSEGSPAGGIGGIRQGYTNPPGALPADVRDYPQAIAESLSQLRVAGVDGPYSAVLSADAYTAVSETSDHGYPLLEHIRRLLSGDIICAPAISGAFVRTTRGGVERAAPPVAPGLARGQRGHGRPGRARRGQRGGHLGVGPERPRLLPQDQVVAHAGAGRLPDPVVVLGARRLVVEVHRPVVAAGQQRVDHPERAARVARAEPKVLVVSRPVLPVEVDVEQLAVPQRLGDPVRVVEPGHLLVPDLRVQPEQLWVLELSDQRQRVPDGGQQHVAAPLVRLPLGPETQRAPPVPDVPRQPDRSFPCPSRAPTA